MPKSFMTNRSEWARLVNDLLDLARMESYHTGLHYEKINVNEFLEKIIRKFSGVAKEKILL